MSAEIIQFRAASRGSPKRRTDADIVAAVDRVLERRLERQLPAPLTVTAKNSRLRREINEDWRAIDAARVYWRARMDMEDAISGAQRHQLPEGKNHPPHDPDERMIAVRKWRETIVAQMLTPAPYASAVVWKRAALTSGEHKYSGVKTERIERAIADDVAWLAAHPTRTKRGRS